MIRPSVVVLALCVAFSSVLALAGTQSNAASVFRARLSTVPVDLTMRKAVAGSGSATATLKGSALAIEGSFKDLVTSATVARLHRGPNRGLRGPAIADLQVEMATNGTIRGSVTLTAEQIDDLRKGRLYIQLHSEKAPDGNLWGWLLADVKGLK